MISNNDNLKNENLEKMNDKERPVILKGDLDEFIFNNGFSKYVSER